MNYRALGAQSITGLHDPIYATSIRGGKRISDCCDRRTIAQRVGGGRKPWWHAQIEKGRHCQTDSAGLRSRHHSRETRRYRLTATMLSIRSC